MLTQMKYAIADIRDHIIRYLINFIQILISIILIASSFKTIDGLNGFLDSVNKLRALENVYIMTDITEEEHYSEMTENPEYIPRLKEFLNYLQVSEEFDRYVVYQYYLYTEEDAEEVYFCESNFADMYNLKTEEGKAVSEIISQDYGDYTPGVFGRGYKNRYSIGDIIETDKGNVIVAGFLSKGSYYFDLASGKERIYLDSKIVCPLMIDKFEDIVDYLSVIERTHIITEDSRALSKISQKANELGLYKFSFKSLETHVQNIINDEREAIQSSLLIVILILSLCVACMLSFLLTFMEEHIREFAIHLLSGATLSKIALRIIIQAGIPIIFANIAAYLWYQDNSIGLRVIFISIILCLFISLIPVVKLYKLGINGVLKRCE